MIRQWVRILTSFVIFVILQALVINNIRLFGVVSAFVYIYVILKLPVDLNRLSIIMISFLLGLVIDMFSNTSGMHAATCTFVGFIRQPLLERLVDMKEIQEGGIPSFRLFGYSSFIRYVLIMTSLHVIILFLTESFEFFQSWYMIMRMVSSIFLTCVLIFIIESFNITKAKSG